MLKLEIEVENFNLNNTFLPSFISSLYEKISENEWIKIAGHLGGKLRLKQSKPNLIEVFCKENLMKPALERRVILETGLWNEPFENKIHSLPSSIRPQIEALSNIYNGVRLPIAPLDIDYLLIAIILSKRADYEKFVLKWCKKIWEKFNGRIDEIINTKYEELKEIGTSYQIKQLKKTLKSFYDLSQDIKRIPKIIIERIGLPYTPTQELILFLPPELARITLNYGVWGMGPKTIDSFILSIHKAIHFIPCDTHLKIVSERLGLIENNETIMPIKNYCAKYACTLKASKNYNLQLCPLAKNNKCIRSKLSYLDKLGGWFQTLAYLHGRKYCKIKNPKCNECPIKNICKKR
jgi:endonuclease III